MKYAEVLAAQVKPEAPIRIAPRIVTLPPEAFGDTYHAKPDAPVAIGVRRVAEWDLQMAKANALDSALRLYPEPKPGTDDPADIVAARERALEDGLIFGIVAQATCDPNNVQEPYFRMAEDVVRVALTLEGATRIYDEVCLLQITKGIGYPSASDPELLLLARLLKGGIVSELPSKDAPDQLEVRKLLHFCLEKLVSLPGAQAIVDAADDDAREDHEDDEVPVYASAPASPAG